MIYILLCAYNEERNIEKLTNAITVAFNNSPEYKIIIVNDGSTDNTLTVLDKISKNIPLTILSHEKNLGLGKALETGFNHVFKSVKYPDILITMDADNTHDPELTVQMINEINKSADIIIASRYAKGGRQLGLSLSRKFLSYCAKILLKVFLPYPGLNDYTCGYRAYNGKILEKLKNGREFILDPSFFSTFEILLKSLKFKPVIKEVPLVLHYENKLGKSKLKLFKTIKKYLLFLIKGRVNTLSIFYL